MSAHSTDGPFTWNVSGLLADGVGADRTYDINGTPVLASYEWHTSDVFEMWLNRRAQPPAHRTETAPALAESRA